MAVLEINQYGHPILRKKCAPVEDFSTLTEIVGDMFDTMYEAEGIGLSANQVGLDLNLCVIEVSSSDETDETHVFVNGEILDREGKSFLEEGCLSIPGVRLEFNRAENIRLKYQDIEGTSHEDKFSGLLARVIQHEMDHLNGKLIVDHVSPLVKMQHKKQLKEIQKNAQRVIVSE